MIDKHVVDKINERKNLEHIETYRMYQDEQLFSIENTDHDLEHVSNCQNLIQKSMFRQVKANKQFKQIYDYQIDQIKADIALMK